MVKMRRRPPRRGEAHYRALLTAHDVRLMRELYYLHAISIRAIAEKFEIGRQTAHDAIVGDTWAHVPMPRLPVR